MSKITFTMTQINQLEEKPNVASLSERSIQHTTEFKVKAVRENMGRKGTSTNLHGGGIRPGGDWETKNAVRVESLAPNVPKRRRGGSPKR